MEKKIWGGYNDEAVNQSLSSELLDHDMIEASMGEWNWRTIGDVASVIVMVVASLAIVMALAIN